MRGIRVIAITALLVAVLAHNAFAEVTVITFDSLGAGTQPGNALSGSGVTFTTGDIPDAIAVGDIITFANSDFQFDVVAANAISPPNVAGPVGGTATGNDNGKDVLISLSSVASFISLELDAADENTGQLIRLIGVTPTGTPNQFTVDQYWAAPDNLPAILSLAGAFQFAIFQHVEPFAEGFDNLVFISATVPEPSTLLLLGAALAGLGGVYRRRKRQ